VLVFRGSNSVGKGVDLLDTVGAFGGRVRASRVARS
jgi:hypothetical protein